MVSQTPLLKAVQPLLRKGAVSIASSDVFRPHHCPEVDIGVHFESKGTDEDGAQEHGVLPEDGAARRKQLDLVSQVINRRGGRRGKHACKLRWRSVASARLASFTGQECGLRLTPMVTECVLNRRQEEDWAPGECVANINRLLSRTREVEDVHESKGTSGISTAVIGWRPTLSRR